jgi:hypothetical protein
MAARETLTAAEQAAALKRRAGEQVAGDPRGAAIVLGMHLQEGDRELAKVVEVAPASPAFDAGVREGDVIVAFDGFRGKSYRDWVDGIRKLVTDTPDGATMSVDVMRGGKRVNVSIRAPEAKADDIRRAGPLGRSLANRGNQSPIGETPFGEQPAQPFGQGADNDIFINNVPFNEAFNAAGDMTERAVAHIYRLSSPQQPVAPDDDLSRNAVSNRATAPGTTNASADDAAASASQRGGRIGLAGFRNDQNGILVMIDVGGLAPGNYRVAIEDPGIVMGGTDHAIPSEVGVPAGTLPPPNPGNEINPRPAVPGQGIDPTQPGTQSNRAGDGRQSGIDRLPSQEPTTVLAQVADTASGEPTTTSATPPTGQVTPTATPPTGQVLPPGTPPTGRVLPPGAPPTGRVLPPGAPATGSVLPPGTPPTGRVDDAAGSNQFGRSGALSVGESGATWNSGSFGTLPAIGNLIVDQSGTGRLQQIVKGIQVRDVVGQAIVIFAPIDPAQTLVPPNTNVSNLRAGAAGNSQIAPQPQPSAGSGQLPGHGQSPVGDQRLDDRPMPIAAGVIRLISDRRPGNFAEASEAQVPQSQPQATSDNRDSASALQPQPQPR